MMPAASAAGEASVHAGRIDLLDSREVVDVVVDHAMARQHPWGGGFVAAAQPHAACAEVVKVAALHGMAEAAVQHSAVTAHIAHGAASDHVAGAATNDDAMIEAAFDGELTENNVGSVHDSHDGCGVVG